MSGIGVKFPSYVHSETDWWGTYPTQVPVAVGDYLEVLADGALRYLGSTVGWAGWAEHLPIDTVKSPGMLTHTAHATRTRSFDAGAGATSAGASVDGKIELEFSKRAGFVLDYQSTEIRRYSSIDTAKRWVLALAQNGQWPENQILVTEVIHAAFATTVIAFEKSSKVRLSGSAAIPPTGAINLADPSLALSAETIKGRTFNSVCAQSSTPLYHCVRVRKSWLAKWDAQLLGTVNTDIGEAFMDDPFGRETDV